METKNIHSEDVTISSATGSGSNEWSLQWAATAADNEDTWIQLWIIFVATIFGLISFIGVIGNALVIYVILSKRQMRTVTNILLLNLAVADLCFVLIVPPMTAYTIIHDSKWWLGLVACKLMHYVTNVSGYVTVYTLVLVSAVRYMTVVHGVTTARLRTIRNMVIMIVSIWVIMLAANCPVLTAYELRRATDRNTQHTDEFLCLETSREVGRYIFVIFFAFSYVIPLTIIALFSLGILHYISKHRGGGLQVSANVNVRTSARKRQASRLLVLVVVIFAMLWLPLHVHLIALHFRLIDGKNPLYDKLSFVFCCLAYFNSCVNPFIYDHMSKDFRDAFREVMHCSHSHTPPAAEVPLGRVEANNLEDSVRNRHCSQRENIIHPLRLSAQDEHVNSELKMAAVGAQSCDDLKCYMETHQCAEELVALCVESNESGFQRQGVQV